MPLCLIYGMRASNVQGVACRLWRQCSVDWKMKLGVPQAQVAEPAEAGGAAASSSSSSKQRQRAAAASSGSKAAAAEAGGGAAAKVVSNHNGVSVESARLHFCRVISDRLTHDHMSPLATTTTNTTASRALGVSKKF
jgi:hypothetical protein